MARAAGDTAGSSLRRLSSLQHITSLVLTRGPIYKISYDLSYDYREFVVRSTDDSDLTRAEISLRNIVS